MSEPETQDARTSGRRLLGGVAGVLAALAGLGLAEGAAALLSGVTGPFLAVGNRMVDAAPGQLKDFAVEHFGTNDKPVLLGGIAAALLLITLVAGAVGVRRPRVGLGVFAVMSVVATVAMVTDRSATAGTGARLVPAVVLAVASLGGLHLMLAALRGVPAASTPGSTPAERSLDRRRFLLAAGAVTVGAVVGGALTRAYGGLAAAADRAGVRLPRPSTPAPPVPEGVEVGVKGVTPYLTSNADFYRVDTALKVPDVPLDTWTLRVHGMVDKELELTYDDLLARDLVERRITLTCVSNEVGGPYLGNATWLGVPVRELLAEAGVKDGADAVRSRSADDWTAGTPLDRLMDDQDEALVAIAMNGEPLPLKHGFPARLVTPGLYGYVSATKWLTELEVTRFSDFTAYWTNKGYDAQAPIKTSSRIDVPDSFARVKAGRVPVAGVAWSQTRGIEKVEVRIDGGPWQAARLGEADNKNTWRQWVFPWDAEPGNHRIEVRAEDGSGYTQTGARAPIAPDGSTGWHSVTVFVA
ncbi:molybdopterin-dependent oxidoreductase [Nocardioides marmoribigeumensis]|uniref:DMSO/TMAO reductase YedYZ molybdopterin-dependent catalytic subunit n=1 Tax=Nocardioides marmoribigeumensis TaxID=433649 RepID=A0ABU2BWY1_9ACTN|nr:molybdopterin-dependent oxidoreductase [Nocardioides marmoribigeumensis]MDR7362449.1 DMSO/TMAO reductase YedYZ molybdopterin-dependent catalytic subunit [Nocardioides marmoribigeumensis]